MTPCPKNENHSSPQDCASCPQGSQSACLEKGCSHSPRLGFQLTPLLPAQLSRLPGALCGDDRTASPALYLTRQMPISSLIHSLTHSFMYLFSPPFIPRAIARRCARRWGYGGKQEIILMSLQDQEPRRTARH